jgi:hypothetical protein
VTAPAASAGVNLGYTQHSELRCDTNSDGTPKVIDSDCWGELATLTTASEKNTLTPVANVDAYGNPAYDAYGNPAYDNIIVFPFALHFKQAQCYCQSVNNGHLASFHTEADYRALEAASLLAGVHSSVFVGAHEVSVGSSRIVALPYCSSAFYQTYKQNR